MLRCGPCAPPCARIKGRFGSCRNAEDGHLTKLETGEGIDDFPGEAIPELSAVGCLNTSQAKDLRKVLEEEQSPVK